MKVSIFTIIGILTFVVGIAATAVVVDTSSNAIQQTADELWEKTAKNTSDLVMERVMFDHKVGRTILRRAIKAVRTGILDPNDNQAIFDWTRDELLTHHGIATMALGRPDGSYVQTIRRVEGTFQSRVRFGEDHVDEFGQPDFGTYYDYDEALIRRESPMKPQVPLNPTNRQWYRDALHAPGFVLTGPFVFVDNDRVGSVLSHKQYGRSSELVGIWSIDFTHGSLSKQLKNLDVIKGSKVVVLTRSGDVVAHPGKGGVLLDDSGAHIVHASSHRDTVLNEAWSAGFAKDLQSQTTFHFGDWIALVQPFPKESEVPWMVLTLVPRSAVFGKLDHHILRSSGIILGIAGCYFLIFFIVSRFIRQRVHALGEEFDKISRLEFEDRPVRKAMFIREINGLSEAADRVRKGLGSFSKYTQRNVVKQLISKSDDLSLGGEIKTLTIAFIDLKGFTARSETLDPQELAEYLRVYFTIANQCIVENQGTVDKFIGDAVMAFWGAPTPLEDHRVAALRSALAIKHELDRVADNKYKFRIGINSGRVMVGNVGSDERMAYTVIGDAVNLASRLETANNSYGTEILVGEDALPADQSEFVFKELDEIQVRGRKGKVRIFELIDYAKNVLDKSA